MPLDIPTPLLTEIREGRTVLLLGAGASRESVDADGRRAPLGEELAQLLVERYLTPEHAMLGLSTIAELAISESNLADVQEYIGSLLAELQPSTAHQLLPTFAWRGLATTNYDCLIEEAYRLASTPAQQLSTVVSNADRMDDALRGRDRLALLKLHGCVTRTRDERIPFILTPDQYVTHRKFRSRLFATLQEWGYENTIIAVGQRLLDPDLRQVLLELSELGDTRPRYYFVDPGGSPQEQRFWDSRKISVIPATFGEFMTELDTQLPSSLRKIIILPKIEHPISAKLLKPISHDAQDYLDSEVEYVFPGMKTQNVVPFDFYRGYSAGWGPIDQNLDVRRRLVDTLLYDVVLPDESDRRSVCELYAIRAEAGAGKTITLRRIAWETAHDAERICLYLSPEGELNYEFIAEVVQAIGERVFLFIDHTSRHASALEDLLARAKRDSLPLTVLTAERLNEWNMFCERLEDHLTQAFTLPYLGLHEITELISLLDRHKALGYLAPLAHEDRVKELEQRAGRQLLVALLEATHGIPYEDILVNEFDEIASERAQALYLTVCVLNRLDIPVRAGLISRAHGIPFTEFKEQLFQPLEHVVIAQRDRSIQDYVYYARHPLIAQVVFDRILRDPTRRLDEYLRLMGSFNLAYQTDLTAFRMMIRGRMILELFPNHSDALAIFQTASVTAGEDSSFFHQRGLYEMHRPNGSLALAYDLLMNGSKLAPRDLTIIHSLAELERMRAEQSTTDIQRRRHRAEARRLASIVRDDPYHGPFGHHTIIKTQIDALRDLLSSTDSTDEIDRLLQDIEQTLEAAQQRFPDNEYMLSAEAELAGLLEDYTRAKEALAIAFQRNPRSPYVANRLARILRSAGEIDNAVKILETAVDANPGEPRLHFSYAMLLREAGRDDIDTMLHHLRRGFSPGDRNYEAQFWYAVYLYMKDSSDTNTQSHSIFGSLWNAPLSFHARSMIRAEFTPLGSSTRQFIGTLYRREDEFGFIRREGAADRIMIRKENLAPGVWESLNERDRVQFTIAFSFGGPTALNVQRLGGSLQQ